MPKREIQPQKFQKLLNKDPASLNAKEKIKLKKEQQAREEFEALKKAAANAGLNNNIANELKNREFHDGTYRSGTLENSQRRMGNAGVEMGTIRQEPNAGTMSDFGSDFDANNRTMSDTRGQTVNNTLRSDIQNQKVINPYTEYDKKFYDPSASNKEYLNDTSKIMVGFDNN